MLPSMLPCSEQGSIEVLNKAALKAALKQKTNRFNAALLCLMRQCCLVGQQSETMRLLPCCVLCVSAALLNLVQVLPSSAALFNLLHIRYGVT
jgi:hypothetical protein